MLYFHQVYDIELYISGQAMGTFSATINAMTSSIGDQCGKLNCGNYSLLPPSERQKYAYDNCVEDVGDARQLCGNVKTWNATAPTPCQGFDGTYGICDPINQHCYAVQDIYTARCEWCTQAGATATHQPHRKDYRAMVQTFITSPLINNFHALDTYAVLFVFLPHATTTTQPTRAQRAQHIRQGRRRLHRNASAVGHHRQWSGKNAAYFRTIVMSITLKHRGKTQR